KITMERTHNMVNRHTGVVVKNGLFSVESVVPGASGVFCLYIKADADDSEKCIETLSKVLGNSLTIGGNRNRGMGRIEFKNLESCRFNLDNAEDYADWLSTRYADAKGLHYTPKKNSRFEATEDTSVLKLKLDIGIPRGEDFVIGYGETLDGLLADPQFVRKIDGKEYWCIPGSSFRGVVKGWMSRLAAKEGFILKDSHDHWNENRKSFKGDELGWGFVGKDERENFKKNPTLLKDPILELFGSLYKRGRIHFSDAYSKEPRKDSDTQLRKHVSIDRFSGGANDGALFSNKVLVGNVKFSMDVSISRKSFDGKDVDADQWKKEITWLKKTFRAINQGIISFGSSKGSGLLEITNLEEINK
ncbi:MAG: hypothetical protein HUK20_03495, partial [Fibrobacter sp.]|nr:hypothetical protein [Fibrobacter sp.]